MIGLKKYDAYVSGASLIVHACNYVVNSTLAVAKLNQKGKENLLVKLTTLDFHLFYVEKYEYFNFLQKAKAIFIVMPLHPFSWLRYLFF